MRIDNLFLLAIVSAILIPGCSRPVFVNDWQSFGLEGKVKSVIEKNYRLTADGKTREIIPDTVVIRNFNESGYLTEIVLLDGDNNYLAKTEFFYEDDRLKKTLDLDRNNQKIRESEVIDWNNHNQPVLSSVKEKEVKLTQQISYEGIRIAEVSILNNSGDVKLCHKYSYIEEGKTCEYVVSHDYEADYSSIIKTDSLCLTYDEYGNWIKKRIETSELCDLLMESERRIIYY